MRMFKNAKFICPYAKCWKSFILETIHYHEMVECSHWRNLCPAHGCKFIILLKIVIIYSINCYYHLLKCAICNHCTMSVLTNDCNLIKSQRLFPFLSNIITKIRQPIIRIKTYFSLK